MSDERASRHLGAQRIRVSFEFFPPKTDEMERTLWESIERLAPLRPNFVSVTYGAGGSTRERTHATVKRILAETALTPAAHLTCVSATRDEIDDVIRAYHGAGVRHIVALRGDPVGGIGERYAPHPGGYENGADLVRGIKRITDAEVSVSAYPEKHPDSASVDTDIDMLKAQGRRGRDPRDHPVLLRERSLFPLSRPRAGARDFRCRSPPASCRCRTSSRRRALPSAPAPRCRTGSPRASRGSTTIRRRAS